LFIPEALTLPRSTNAFALLADESGAVAKLQDTEALATQVPAAMIIEKTASEREKTMLYLKWDSGWRNKLGFATDL